MHDQYLVGFTYDSGIPAVISTARELEKLESAAEQKNYEFQLTLQYWLGSQGYHELEFCKPSIFPILAVRCSSETANLIAKHPSVDFVRRDGISTRCHK